MSTVDVCLSTQDPLVYPDFGSTRSVVAGGDPFTSQAAADAALAVKAMLLSMPPVERWLALRRLIAAVRARILCLCFSSLVPNSVQQSMGANCIPLLSMLVLMPDRVAAGEGDILPHPGGNHGNGRALVGGLLRLLHRQCVRGACHIALMIQLSMTSPSIHHTCITNELFAMVSCS